jgi:cephalosporin hydroxylase
MFSNEKKRIIEILNQEGLYSLSKTLLLRIKMNFYAKYLKLKVKKFQEIYTVESLIDFVFLTNEGIIKPFQVRSEILRFLKLIRNYKPKFILEIGTGRGGTLFLFSRTAAVDAIIISIDLPRGKYGGGYQEWKIDLFKSFSLSKQKMFLIRGNSHEIKSLNRVKKILKGNKLDLLYIDGDHSYEGAKRDFEMYKPLIKKGGIIAVHDIVPIKNIEYNVEKFWNEIKDMYDYEEIVEDWNQNLAGFGIIKVRE